MSDAEPSVRRRRARWPQFVLLFSALGAATWAAWYVLRGEALPAGVSQDEFTRAERRFWMAQRRMPDRLDTLMLLAEVAVAENRLPTAVVCFQEIPSTHPRYGPPARLQEAQVLARMHRASVAERSFREFLSLVRAGAEVPREQVVTAYKWLVYLLSVELRFEERKPLLAEMHEAGLADVYDSKQYYFPHLLIWHTSTGSEPLEEYVKADARNVRLQIALARYRIFQGRLEEARSLLEGLSCSGPERLQCHGAWLEYYFERDDRENFSAMARQLPAYDAGEPWLLTRMRGEFALHEERWEEAVEHFERVLQSDPANPWSQMGLASAYAGLGRPQAREEALRRSLVLSDIRASLFNVNERDPEPARKLAAACEKIGLTGAAETFRRHAARIEQSRDGREAVALPQPPA